MGKEKKKKPTPEILYTEHRDQKADELWLEDFTKSHKELIAGTFFRNWKEFAGNEYFEQLAENLHEKFPENPNLTGKIDSMQEYQYFLEFRYQRNLEKWFTQCLKQGVLVEPKFLFIFDKNKTQEILKRITSLQYENEIIRYELLFFGITFEKIFVEAFGKSYTQTESEYGILKTYNIHEVTSEEDDTKVKTFSTSEEVTGERKRQFIPYLVFNGNVGRIESGNILKQKNLKETDEIDLISETVKIASEKEMSKIDFLTHFIDPETKGFKQEFETVYDVLDKLESLKSTKKLGLSEKSKISTMGIDTLFKNLDYKYCFFLYGKEYIDIKTKNIRSISFGSGNAYPILLSPAIFINSKIQGLAQDCKFYLKYNAKKGEVDFGDFETEFKKQLDSLTNEKIKGLSEKIYHSTELRLCAFQEEVELGKNIWR